MARNDLILLDGIIDARIAERLPNDKPDEVFEYFVFEQVLKDYDLSKDELESGWVDGRDDGGLDGIYTVVNGRLIQDLAAVLLPARDAVIDVWMISAKHHATFEQRTLDTIHATLSELLDLALPDNALRGSYSDLLLSARALFHAVYRKLAASSVLRFHIVYGSRGETSQLGASVAARASQIATLLQSMFSSCEARVDFVGASELVALHRRKRRFSLDLPFVEYLSSTGDGYVLIVRLRDYFDFVKDEYGNLRRYLFDSNVRDYLGDNNVNEDIALSLSDPHAPDFWWMNNGVTILATRAPVVGKEIQLHDVQIVNGLQTTETIFKHFTEFGDLNEDRGLLVKVVLSEDEAIRDRIIRATNNQSVVEPASLRATDKVQRDIEIVLEQHGWFYERRKNYHLNQGKPPARFISPLFAAAGYVGLVLRNPQAAASLKQRFMRNDYAYRAIFSERTPLELWPVIVDVLKRAEAVLETVRPERRGPNERFLARTRNLLGLITVARLFGTFSYSVQDLVSLDPSRLTPQLLLETWHLIDEIHQSQTNEKRKKRYFLQAVRCCEEAARRFEVDGIGIVGRKGPYGLTGRSTALTQGLLDKVDSALPKQPWPRGIHNAIARNLRIRPSEVYDAIAALIESGRRKVQRDGVVYDSDGNVILESSAPATRSTLHSS